MASSEIFFQTSNSIFSPVRNEEVFILYKFRDSSVKIGCRIGSDILSVPIRWYMSESLLVATQNIVSRCNFTNIWVITFRKPVNKSDLWNSGRIASLEISQELCLEIPKLSQLPKYVSKGNFCSSLLLIFTLIVAITSGPYLAQYIIDEASYSSSIISLVAPGGVLAAIL